MLSRRTKIIRHRYWSDTDEESLKSLSSSYCRCQDRLMRQAAVVQGLAGSLFTLCFRVAAPTTESYFPFASWNCSCKSHRAEWKVQLELSNSILQSRSRYDAQERGNVFPNLHMQVIVVGRKCGKDMSSSPRTLYTQAAPQVLLKNLKIPRFLLAHPAGDP